jgi:hypothetical protein
MARPAAGEQARPEVQLAAMPTGVATLTWDQRTQLITAAIEMAGFTPSASHGLQMRPGSCTSEDRGASVPFPDISAGPGGAVRESVTSTVPQPRGIPGRSYITIPLAPSARTGRPGQLGSTPIACADIPAGVPAHGPVKVMLHPAAPMRGSASLAYNPGNRTLRVEVRAHGLQPNTAHAVHIHSGSCLAQGDVLYPLPDLRTDRSGRASETAVIHNVSSAPPATGWYLNVHMGAANEIQHGNAPTLLFAPILCGNIS